MLHDPDFMNNLILAIIAIANALGAYLAYHNRAAISAVGANVSAIEKATNSMKDDLIKTANERGVLKGIEAGRVLGEAGVHTVEPQPKGETEPAVKTP